MRRPIDEFRILGNDFGQTAPMRQSSAVGTSIAAD